MVKTKAYIIIYNGTQWEPRECTILEELKDLQGNQLYKIKYHWNNQVKKNTVPGKHVFFTFNAANEFAKHYATYGN